MSILRSGPETRCGLHIPDSCQRSPSQKLWPLLSPSVKKKGARCWHGQYNLKDSGSGTSSCLNTATFFLHLWMACKGHRRVNIEGKEKWQSRRRRFGQKLPIFSFLNQKKIEPEFIMLWFRKCFFSSSVGNSCMQKQEGGGGRWRG